MATDVVALRQRVLVREAVKNCQSCALHKSCKGPVPFSGPSNPSGYEIAVVGESTSEQGDKSREPFAGPSKQLVERWLERAGVDGNTVGWVNVVSCFPGRTPTEDEVRACSSNLRDQLAVMAPRVALVLGGVAVNAWWGRVHPTPRMGEMRGRVWKDVNTNVWAMGTWHPSAVLRNRELGREAEMDVRKLVLVGKLLARVNDGGVVSSQSPTTAGFSKLVDNDYCVKGCGEYADRFLTHDNVETTDQKGITGAIGWCEKHWGQRMGNKVVKRTRKKKVGGGEQLGLEVGT